MRRTALILTGGCAMVLAAGCTGNLADVPSLAPRPAERQPILSPDEASEPAIAADPKLAAELARLIGEAETAHAAFEKERLALAPTIDRAKGAAEGGETWIAGQEALSALSSRQGPVREAAAAIDALRADPAHAAAADRTALDNASSEVAALIDAEAKVMAALG